MASHRLGSVLIALGGLLMVGYGIAFLLKNFSGFIEIGLGPEHAGATPEQIRAFSPLLHNYISHLHAGISGLFVSLGLAVASLGLFGVRAGQRWAAWTALLAPLIGLAIAVPLHYVYEMATVAHLGPVYASLALVLAGFLVVRKSVSKAQAR